jgi:uncharacterized PurR-regulated membrane protein YhhQ (DUF165 family)
LADTFLVVTVLFAGVQPASVISGYILDGWFFKVLVAAADTVLIYIIIYFFKKVFNLKQGQEIEI